MKFFILIMILVALATTGCSTTKELSKVEQEALINQLAEEAKKPEYQLKQLNELTIIGADWCPGCNTLKSSLKKEGYPYEYLNIEKNTAAAEIAQLHGRIPIVIINRSSEELKVCSAQSLVVYMMANPELFERYRLQEKEEEQSTPEKLGIQPQEAHCTSDGACTIKTQ